MDWNAIGAIAELVAAVGVIVTLLYLAVQVRQNTKALRAATYQNIIDLATGFAESVARDRELASIFQAGLADLGSLQEVDRLRFHYLMISLLRRFENVHYHSTVGLLDDLQWEGLRASLNHIVGHPGSRAWWHASSYLFNASFRGFMETSLTGATPAASPDPRVYST